MTRRVRINRLLWCAIGVVVLAGFSTALWKYHELHRTVSATLSIPHVVETPPVPAGHSPSLAQNPFAKDGVHWRNPLATSLEPNQAAGNASLRGVIRLPGKAMAVTDQGFLPLGGSWGAGKIKAITAQGIQVSNGDKTQTLELHPGRKTLSTRILSGIYPQTTPEKNR